VHGQAAKARLPIAYALPSIESMQPPAVLMHAAHSNATMDFTLEVADFAGEGADLSGMSVMIGGAPCAALAALGNITLHCTGVAVEALLQGVTIDPGALTVPLNASIATGGVTRVLDRAGSVTTHVSVVAVSLAEVPVGGGVITVSGSGFALPGVVGGGGVSVSLGAGGRVSCGGVVLMSGGSRVQCRVPAGVGGLSPVVVSRAGGVTGARNVTLAYTAPRVDAVQPTAVAATPADINLPACVNVTIMGSSFGHATPDGAFAMTLGGAPCAAVRRLHSGSLLCSCLDTRQVGSALPSIAVHMLGLPVAVSPVASLEVVPLPTVTQLVPTQASAVGGGSITVFGSGFTSRSNASAGDVISVQVGNGSCVTVSDVTAVSLVCELPPLTAAAPSAAGSAEGAVAVPINVITVGGASYSGQILTYVQPSIVLVSGAQLSAAAQLSPNRTRNIIVRGTELAPGGVPPTAVYFDMNGTDLGTGPCNTGSSGNASCRVQLPDISVDGTGAVLCRGLDMAQLGALSGPGDSIQLRLHMVLASGAAVQSDVGAVRVQGAPTLKPQLVPASAAVGATVSIQGGALGYSATDISSITLGGVLLPRQDWAWNSPESITITSLPEPLSEDMAGSQRVSVTVALRFGTTASQSRAFSWVVPLRPPVTAPSSPCSYRDEAGAAHLAALWPAGADVVTQVNPVDAWVVQHRDSADANNMPVSDVVPASSSDTVLHRDNSTVRGQLAALCPALLADWQQGDERIVDVTVRSVDASASSVPRWLVLAASTDGSDDSLTGRRSVSAAVLFPRCQSAPGPTEQYLATQHIASGRWKVSVCVVCPEGARCRGLPWEAMTNQPGWQRAEWDPLGLTFLPCETAAACPVQRAGFSLPTALQHSSNGTLPSAFLDSSGEWAPMAGQGTGGDLTGSSSGGGVCDAGHTGHLCKRCAGGWSRAAGGTCAPCAAPALQWLSLAGGLLLAAALLGYMIHTTLQGTAEAVATDAPIKPYVALNKLLFSHLQQIAIAASFPMKWPPLLLSMFATFDTSASMSQDLISVDCFQWSESAFTAGTITQLLLPLIVLCVLCAVWGSVAAVRVWCGSGASGRLSVAVASPQAVRIPTGATPTDN